MKKSSRIWSLCSLAALIGTIVLAVVYVNIWKDVISKIRTIEDIYSASNYFPILIALCAALCAFCWVRNVDFSIKHYHTAMILVGVATLIIVLIGYKLTKEVVWQNCVNFAIWTPHVPKDFDGSVYWLPIVYLCIFYGMLVGFVISTMTKEHDVDHGEPNRPTMTDGGIICYVIAFFLFLFFVNYVQDKYFVSKGIFLFYLGMIFCIAPILVWKSKIRTWRENPWQYAIDEQNRLEEKRKRGTENAAKMKAWNDSIEEEKKRQHIESKIPDCPNCGSYDVTRISTLSRTASVMTVGLASSKIGKQYKCNKCKHMW